MTTRVLKFVSKSTIVGLAALLSNQVFAAPSMTVDSNGGLKVFELNNPSYWFTLGGRLHLDTVFYSGDQTQFPSGSTIHSAKLSFKGGVGNDWVYKFDITEADKATRRSSISGGASIGEAFLAYNGFNTVWVAFGQVAVPAGLESATSANDLPFMEQSLPGSAFSSDVGLGVNVTWEGKMFNFSGSIVHPKAGSQQGQSQGNISPELSCDPVGLGARLTFSPVHDALIAYHTGFTYRHQNLRDFAEFNFMTKPELRSRQSPFLTTNLPLGAANYYDVFDVEAAGRFGPYMLASEYFYSKVYGSDHLPNLSYYGYYVMGSYVLTGEIRPYDLAGATFGGVKPRCKTGAWELSLRHSYVKLLDNIALQSGAAIPEFLPLPAALVDDIVGNAYTTTVGLTWWVNENVRFMANYSYMNYVDVISTGFIGGGIPQPNINIGAFGLRGQVSW